jgi:hypothetical protein
MIHRAPFAALVVALGLALVTEMGMTSLRHPRLSFWS